MLLSDLVSNLNHNGCQVSPHQIHYAQMNGYVRKPMKVMRNVFDYDARIVTEYLAYFRGRHKGSRRRAANTD
jgi:hypothetical protein